MDEIDGQDFERRREVARLRQLEQERAREQMAQQAEEERKRLIKRDMYLRTAEHDRIHSLMIRLTHKIHDKEQTLKRLETRVQKIKNHDIKVEKRNLERCTFSIKKSENKITSLKSELMKKEKAYSKDEISHQEQSVLNRFTHDIEKEERRVLNFQKEAGTINLTLARKQELVTNDEKEIATLTAELEKLKKEEMTLERKQASVTQELREMEKKL